MSSNDVTGSKVGMTRAEDIPVITFAAFSAKFRTKFVVFVRTLSVASSATTTIHKKLLVTIEFSRLVITFELNCNKI